MAIDKLLLNLQAKKMNKIIRFFDLCKKRKFSYIQYKIIDRLSRLFLKNGILPPFPYWVIIEPSNICNLNCPLCCINCEEYKQPRRMMSFAEFKGIIDEVRNFAIKVDLYNNGEPFLNPDVLKMITYAVQAHMEVHVNTNGHFFESRAFVVELIKTGLTKLVFSIDGKDQETYAKYRIGGNLEKVIDGLKLIAETKRELKSKIPEIELQFLLLKHNVHQREEMRRLAQESGADIYSEKTINLISVHSIDDPRSQELLKTFLPMDLSLTRFELKNGKLDYKGEILNCCPLLNHSVLICSDGSVSPCACDTFSQHIMGNVFHTPLKEIWRGSRYQALRKGVKNNRKAIPVCNFCFLGRDKKLPMITRYRLQQK